MAAFEPGPLLERLADAGVEFVIIGAFAVIAYGYVRATRDLDIVPAPTPENYERLAALLGVGELADESSHERKRLTGVASIDVHLPAAGLAGRKLTS